MAKQRLVLIGNGMAGVRTLEELLALAPDACDITVFGAEPHPNYNRILLSPVLAGEQTLPQIVLNDREWYAANGIALHLGREVAKIDRIRREVVAADGTVAPYDRVLLATGSTPVILPIPGRELPGVITYRDIADTDAMIAAAKQYRAADGRSTYLHDRRVRSPSRLDLRPRRASVREDESLRESPGADRHRPLYRIADVDQAQGDGHRSLLGRGLHRRARYRGNCVVGPRERR